MDSPNFLVTLNLVLSISMMENTGRLDNRKYLRQSLISPWNWKIFRNLLFLLSLLKTSSFMRSSVNFLCWWWGRTRYFLVISANVVLPPWNWPLLKMSRTVSRTSSERDIVGITSSHCPPYLDFKSDADGSSNSLETIGT